jgi:hypothetical protein
MRTALLCAFALLPLIPLQPTTRHEPGSNGPTHDGFDPGRASFSLHFNKETTPYRVIATFVLPGEELTIEALATGGGNVYRAQAAQGTLSAQSTSRWTFLPPSTPGLYPVTVRQLEPADSIRLNVFVMVPFSKIENEHLNGYRIGRYPARPLKGMAIYNPPRGFIEVTRENRETLVAPHFRLSQFLCKQESEWPKYIVLQERLLLKLELILAALNESGYRASTLAIMSGYRTPFYNQAIGNVQYSRHVWGGASDIYVDESPRDGVMDDLNGDGRIDNRDAGVIYDLIDGMHGEPWYATFVGGLGRYRKTSSHGPFVHVDVRGFRARWGS